MEPIMQQSPERSNKKTVSIIGVVLIVILAVAYLFFRGGRTVSAVDHLILGVPAYTLYNTFMDMEPTYIDSTKSVLDYWGHPTVSLNEIKKIYGSAGVSTAAMNGFFQKRGYQTEVYDPSVDGYSYDGLMEKTKAYIQKDIPVIVRQQRTTNPDDVADGTRVVIGISDKTQKVTVHDYQYGNNYEISYADFKEMSRLKEGGASMLAVWPGDLLKSRLQPVDRTKPYPARNADMQRIGDLWQIRANALEYGFRGDMPKSIELLKEMVAKDEFKNLLPPAYQYGVYDCLVRRLFAVNKPDEVIEIVKNNMAPIDQNLNAPFGIWTGQIDLFKRISFTTTDRLAYHYFWLGQAYALRGQTGEAKQAFSEGMKIEPKYYEVILQMKKAMLTPVLKSMRSLKLIN